MIWQILVGIVVYYTVIILYSRNAATCFWKELPSHKKSWTVLCYWNDKTHSYRERLANPLDYAVIVGELIPVLIIAILLRIASIIDNLIVTPIFRKYRRIEPLGPCLTPDEITRAAVNLGPDDPLRISDDQQDHLCDCPKCMAAYKSYLESIEPGSSQP